MSEEIKNVSLDLIDDPSIAMRTHMDDERLDELASSIKSHGLIQPVTLRRNGDRYEVVAGHRRTLAARRAGLALIPAIVRELNAEQADELKVHENLFREDVNPVDEARYIVRMIDSYGKSPKELAEMVGKSESYLRARYDLLHYPDYLIEAVESEDISLSAAQWLARITNDVVRKDYTRYARLGGITAKRAHSWFQSWSVGNLPGDPEKFEPPADGEVVESPALQDRCEICGYLDEVNNLRMAYVHDDCRRALRDVNKESQPAAGEA